MTQRTHGPGLRRLTVAATWLGTAALVVGGSSAAIAVPSEADGPVPPSSTGEYTVASTPSSAAPIPVTGTVAGEYVVVLKDNAERQADGMPTAAPAKQVQAAVAHGRKLGAVVQQQF